MSAAAMRKRRAGVMLGTALVAGVLLPPAAATAAEPPAGARDLAQAAEDLCARNRHDEAIRNLEQALAAPPARPEDRALLRFTLAWALQARSALPRETSRGDLERAEREYGELLKDYPQNTQALNNLAAVQEGLGRVDDAARSRERAASTPGSTDRGQHVLKLGDYLRATGKPESALKAYREAFETLGHERAAAERTTDTLAHLPADNAGDLLQFAADLEARGLEDLAAGALEAAIGKAHAHDPRVATEACERWAALVVEADLLGPPLLARLPAPDAWHEGGRSCISELHRAAAGNVQGPGDLLWWAPVPARANTAAGALLLAARRERRAGKAGEALRILDAALKVAPDESAYGGLEEKYPAQWVYLEIAREAVGLLAAERAAAIPDHLRLDQLARRFEEIQDRLFRSKGAAIRSRDYPAMERFHTTLGLIYADLGQWDGSSAMSAIFQLEHAIEAAQDAVKEAGKPYRPLPHLHRLLVTAHEKAARPQNADEYGKKAGRHALLAIEGYLDCDDLESARALVKRFDAGSLRAPAEDAARLTEARDILARREGIAALAAREVPPSTEEIRRAARALDAWARGAERPPGAFLLRQRFKALSDLGALGARSGAEPEALVLHSAALGCLPRDGALASYLDVERLGRAGRVLEREARFTAPGPLVAPLSSSRRQGPAVEGRRTWKVARPSGDALVVAVDEDLLTAGRVFTAASALDPEARPPRFAIDRGAVLLPAGQPVAENEKARKVFITLEGIKSVDLADPEKIDGKGGSRRTPGKKK